MTLNTRIYVKGKFDAKEFYLWANENLLGTTTPISTYREPGVQPHPWRDGETIDYNHYELHNAPGQGLNAWFSLDWYDEPHQHVNEYFDPEDYEEDVRAEAIERNARQEALVGEYYAEMSFDTGYGFRGANGEGCTELHATFIVRMYREYFEPRGIDIVWQDEYTGDLWANLDQEGLTKFMGSGDKAMNWFNNVVVPVITAEAIVEGGTVEWQ